MIYRKHVKRCIDLVISLLLLICVSPIFLIISILIKVDSKGQVLFLHDRVGRSGKVFKIIKFRTMINNASSIGPWFTQKNDNRITRIGRVLRKTSLDEIPQLINVLIGDMSLIGPRPDSPKQRELYQLEEFNERHSVFPGVTGLAQVNGRSALTANERLNYDLQYVGSVSFLVDIKIVIKTVFILLGQKNSW